MAMEILKYLFICVGGYLLGSVSVSIILSRAFGVDIRKKGSGNAGATNMARSFGLLAGFALFYDFRGGKGISVGAAIGLMIDWRVFVGIIIVFLIAAFLSKKASFGSLCAAVAIVALALIFAVPLPKLLLAIYAAVLAVFQHRANIKRLSEGTEPDFKAADTK